MTRIPLIVVAGLLVAATKGSAQVYANRLLVRATVQGVRGTQVRLFSKTAIGMAVGDDSIRIRRDTIVATVPVRLQAYLDAGELHISAIGNHEVEVTARIDNAPAVFLSGKAGHVILHAGGTGVTLERAQR